MVSMLQTFHKPASAYALTVFRSFRWNVKAPSAPAPLLSDFGDALGRLWGGFRVASGWLLGAYRLATTWPEGGLRVASGWLREQPGTPFRPFHGKQRRTILKGTGNTLLCSRFGYGKRISTRAKSVNSEHLHLHGQ